MTDDVDETALDRAANEINTGGIGGIFTGIQLLIFTVLFVVPAMFISRGISGWSALSDSHDGAVLH